jgi:sec-independent protein translocase protein TatA
VFVTLLRLCRGSSVEALMREGVYHEIRWIGWLGVDYYPCHRDYHFIVIIIFGVGKLPEIGGALGKSIREFRESSKNETEESGTDEESVNESKA